MRANPTHRDHFMKDDEQERRGEYEEQAKIL